MAFKNQQFKSINQVEVVMNWPACCETIMVTYRHNRECQVVHGLLDHQR